MYHLSNPSLVSGMQEDKHFYLMRQCSEPNKPNKYFYSSNLHSFPKRCQTPHPLAGKFATCFTTFPEFRARNVRPQGFIHWGFGKQMVARKNVFFYRLSCSAAFFLFTFLWGPNLIVRLFKAIIFFKKVFWLNAMFFLNGEHFSGQITQQKKSNQNYTAKIMSIRHSFAHRTCSPLWGAVARFCIKEDMRRSQELQNRFLADRYVPS